jgi:uncharacterized protein (DUF2141 family)
VGKIAKNITLPAAAAGIISVKSAAVNVMNLTVMFMGLKREAESQILSSKKRMKSKHLPKQKVRDEIIHHTVLLPVPNFEKNNIIHKFKV